MKEIKIQLFIKQIHVT